MNLGFSTGSLALGDFNLALDYMKDIDAINTVELSSLREIELEIFIEHIHLLHLEKYNYVSFHAPSKLLRLSEEQLISKLKVIAKNRWHIVVHPDIIYDYSKWKALGSYLCIENMDKRKSIGRTVDSLDQIFKKLPEATFCFDIAHARQVDPTMREASKMIEKFENRLVQIHISSVGSQSKHEPISVESILAYKKVSNLLSNNVPIVIESPVSREHMELELSKVGLVFEDSLFENYINSISGSMSAHYKYQMRDVITPA